ncbi:MAG TPA: hypothetical protein PL033_14080 [Candidatus Brocadiia bacterium]|nr:hypothetical protein [Candidatus Brocadiia bacterium]
MKTTDITIRFIAAVLASSFGCAAIEREGQGPPEFAAGQWRVRDVAADGMAANKQSSGIRKSGVDSEVSASQLGIRLKSEAHAESGVLRLSCECADTTGRDRAVTLSFCMKFEASGGVWHDDPQRARKIEGVGEFANLVDVGYGVTGMASLYPLAVVSVGDKALCLAVPPEPPRMVRFVYDTAQKEFRAEFDFGLSPIPELFPSRADAAVIAYEVGVEWPFRRALARYYDLYPDAFRRRVSKGGIWLPFQSIANIQRPEDFGFAFREVAPGDLHTVAEDDKLGVGSFIYCEPQTNWRSFRGEEKPTYEAYLAQLKEDADGGDAKSRATLNSAIEREDGRCDLYLEPIAWTKQAPFGCNADPGAPSNDFQNKAQYEMSLLEKVLGWKDQPPAGLDGVYIDSMEGWGLIQNYRREHWRVTRYPLTFNPETRKVCLFNFWGTHAFIKDLSGRLWEKGMALMGNDAFFRFWFLAPYVDIPGREYRWIEDGKWQSVSDERYLFLRSMAARRPYLMLMNNDYDAAGGRMEEYFQRSLFYAVYPSMFHGHSSLSNLAYFYNPDWYNRDRHLFLKYVPLIRRLDLAGWEPVPFAAVAPEEIRIERYGLAGDGNLAFTVHNPTDAGKSVVVKLMRKELGIRGKVGAMEWIGGSELDVSEEGEEIVIRLELNSHGYAAIGIDSIKWRSGGEVRTSGAFSDH